VSGETAPAPEVTCWFDGKTNPDGSPLEQIAVKLAPGAATVKRPICAACAKSLTALVGEAAPGYAPASGDTDAAR